MPVEQRCITQNNTNPNPKYILYNGLLHRIAQVNTEQQCITQGHTVQWCITQVQYVQLCTTEVHNVQRCITELLTV